MQTSFGLTGYATRLAGSASHVLTGEPVRVDTVKNNDPSLIDTP
jgi:hypothetical protein